MKKPKAKPGGVRVRLAPSPTGMMHVGTAYQAILNWAFAKKENGSFILRIEDTDIKRKVEGAEEAIYQGLSWLGIEPDEDPRKGGPFAPYRQSERLPLYQKYAHQLVEKGHAYFCFCSPERLSKVRKKRQAQGKPLMYDKKCRALKKKEAEKKAKTQKYVIRLKVPENEKIVINEPIRGKIVFDSNTVDDQVLLKSDGFPTYHLAVVVDDHLMKITHGIRGEEWLSSFPKHFLLYKFLGWKPPLYFHTPIIRNPDRSKLSKRTGHTSLAWYREQGYLPEAVINFLCLLGWSHPEEKEIFNMNEFIKFFDLKDLSPVGPVFDLKKLNWLNGVYIRKKSDGELAKLLRKFAPKDVNSTLIAKTVPLVKERMEKLSDYQDLASFFFKRPEPKKNLFEKNAKIHLISSIKVLEKLDKWEEEKIAQVLQGLVKKKGWGMGHFFMNFRVALTGSRFTPPITDSAAILGKAETLTRLNLAKNLFS